MGDLDLYCDHMWTEGSLAFHCNECLAFSMRGSIDRDPVGAALTGIDPCSTMLEPNNRAVRAPSRSESTFEGCTGKRYIS